MVAYGKLRAALASGVLVLGLAGCDDVDAVVEEVPTPTAAESVPASDEPLETSEPSPTPSPSPSPEPITFVHVVDGDTIETSIGTVRLVGIDAPEFDECGYDEASGGIGRLVAPGDEIELVLPDGQNDRDAHDRWLRYVTTADGADLGLAQLEAGHAVARYDSTDGYPEHPAEQEYRDAQRAMLTDDGRVVAVGCEIAPVADVPIVDPTPPAVPDVAAESNEPWYMQYGSCSQLRKNTVGDPMGPFDVNDPDEVDIYNWFQYGTGHSGDGDGDGLACE